MQWSGENWDYVSDGYVQSIEVIEPAEVIPKKGRKKKHKKVKKVPFGFARALEPKRSKRGRSS